MLQVRSSLGGPTLRIGADFRLPEVRVGLLEVDQLPTGLAVAPRSGGTILGNIFPF